MLTTQLSLKGVSKSYGERRVLDQVTFSVRPGERAGIVGENGSGKPGMELLHFFRWARQAL
ncbi:hypothetical protein ACFQ08_09320 [Streptosporangium algeriense]|uniref:ABC transporter domain-containing protein n=1 Tax=Streptosporangium algeriense TaxID=1682748 RepID=A0ABW3DLJ1_9ACTN